MYQYIFAGIMTALLVYSAAGGAAAQAEVLLIESGDHTYVNAPVEVAMDIAEAPSMITVKNVETQAVYPATLRGGILTFIVDALAANTQARMEVVSGDRPEDAPARVLISKRGDGDVLDVHIDGVHFTSYHYGDEWRKPFLWPVNTEGGVGITRDFPMEVESTPRIARDHPHHKSLWTAYGEVNGHDLWAEGANAGNQRSKEVTFGSGDAYGWIRAANTWESKDGEALVDETREYRFYATPESARLLDVQVTFKAAYGDVLFSDTKEGGIVSVRMRPDISHARAVITNAHGDQGEDTAWGKPSPWCDFSGDVPEVGWRGLTIFDHPQNLRHPSSWHVRNYGLMGANAFGYSYFNEKEYNKGLIPENGDHTITADTELPFSYRVYVHSGSVEEAAVAERYRDYAAPPKARIAE